MSDCPPPFSLWPHRTCRPTKSPVTDSLSLESSEASDAEQLHWKQQRQWHGPISDSSIGSLSRTAVKSQCRLQRQQWIGPPIRAVPKACAISLLSPTDRCRLQCANPSCRFKVHFSVYYGGFCCKKCFWHYAVDLSSHGKMCAGIAASASDTRAPPMSPLPGIGRQRHGRKAKKKGTRRQ